MARTFVAASSQYLETGAITPPSRPVSMNVMFKSSNGLLAVLLGYTNSVSITERQEIGPSAANASVFAEEANTTFATATSSTGYTNGVWATMTGVFANATSRAVYLAGAGKGTNATSKTPAAMNKLTLGRYGGSTPNNYFTGDACEVSIFVTNGLSDRQAAALGVGAAAPLASLALNSYYPFWPGYTTFKNLLRNTAASDDFSDHSTTDARHAPIFMRHAGGL